MKRKSIKILLSATVFTSLPSALALNFEISKNDINFASNKKSLKQSINKEKRFSSSYNKINYEYDDKVFSSNEIRKIKTFSNKDTKDNRNIAKEYSSESPLWLQTDTDGSIEATILNYVSAVNSLASLPEYSVGFEYQNIDPSQENAAPSTTINKNNLTSWTDFYVYKNNLPWKSLDKPLAGVVSLNQVYYGTELEDWEQFSICNSNDAYSVYNNLSDGYPTINDKSLPFYSKYDYGDWKRNQITLAILDNKYWFTEVGSSIEVTGKNLNSVSISSLKQKSIDEILEYFNITFNNTPRYCVSNGANDEASVVNVQFDDNLSRVQIDITIPRTYNPKFANSLGVVDRNWIENNELHETFYFGYNQFQSQSTTIKSNVQENGIQADSSISGLSPYDIYSQLGTNNANDNKSLILKFIYNNRSLIFENLPNQYWDNSNYYDNLNLNDGYYEFVNATSTSLTFKFGIRNIINTNNSLETSWQRKYFEIKITGLTNKDTSMKSDVLSSGISASGSNISQYAPYELATGIGGSKSSTEGIALKTFLQTNYVNIFNNPVLFPESDNDFISIISDTGEVVSTTSTSITFKFTVKSIYSNGSQVGNPGSGIWDQSLYKKFQITITGLTNKDTRIKDSAMNSGITIDPSLANYTQSDLVGATVNNSQQTQYVKLKNWLGSIYSTQIFENAPSRLASGTTGIEITAGPSADSIYVSISANAGCAYVNGKLSTDSTSFSGKVLIKGLHVLETAIKSSSIVVSNNISLYSPHEIANSLGVDQPNDIKDNLLKFIYDNRNSIFSDLPSEKWDNAQFYENINLNNGYYEFVDSTSTSITFKFSVKNIYENGILNTSWQPKYFELTLAGLTNKDTAIKQDIKFSGIQSSGELSSYSPYEIQNAITSINSNNIRTSLEDFLKSNVNLIFDNLPPSEDRNVWVGPALEGDATKIPYGHVQIISPTSLKINFTMDNYIGNGKILKGIENVPKQNFSVQINGLKNKGDTPSNNASNESSSLEWWVWLVIGLSILIIILLIILFIFLKKKKESNKNKKPINSSINSRIVNKGTPPNNRLGGPSINNIQPRTRQQVNSQKQVQSMRPGYPMNIQKPVPPPITANARPINNKPMLKIAPGNKPTNRPQSKPVNPIRK